MMATSGQPTLAILEDPEALVLLTTGVTAPAASLDGVKVLVMNLVTGDMQAANVSVVQSMQGVGLLFEQRGLAIFAQVRQPQLPHLPDECCVLPLLLLRSLPHDASDRILSLGSREHMQNSAAEAHQGCVPCKFHCTSRGCKDGILCGLCHFPHDELTRSAKRSMLRRIGNMQPCSEYRRFVDPIFHALVETLRVAGMVTQPLLEQWQVAVSALEPNVEEHKHAHEIGPLPVFFKNTFLHFSGDEQKKSARRVLSVPRKLRASPKAAPIHQPEPDPEFMVVTEETLLRGHAFYEAPNLRPSAGVSAHDCYQL